MKITDKLDYIHVVDLGGEGTISDLFKKLGEKDAKGNKNVLPDAAEQSEMRTTSLRIEASLLAAFDAVSSRFELSRNEAFAYAVELYLDTLVNSYALGVSEASEDLDSTKEQSFCTARINLIDSLVCDDDVKKSITWLTNPDACKIAKGLK
jgi:hypothetical protein|tara:strand:- start:1055 stop:1507 length:453 start_codon:yes stop_codon:yes gene_type:complete